MSIDLSLLPSPDVVEPLDVETIFDEMLADLIERLPEFTALVESDPAYKLLEVAAYREMLLRQRINDAARAVMVAYATGADLDNIAAKFNVTRLVVEAGNPDASPPVLPTLEDDERLRRRVPLAFESLSTAGPVGSYVFHALAASGEVKDVSATSPTPGDVIISVLSTKDDGAAADALIAAVALKLNDEDVRPLSDRPVVQSAEIISYAIDASLTFYPGPDRGVILAAAVAAAESYVDKQHRIGYDVTLSGIYAALHQPGVHNVTLVSPATDIAVSGIQAAYCTGVEVNDGGLDE